MEGIKEFLIASDLVGWVIVAAMVFIGFRLLLKTGALLIKVAILVALGFVLFRFYPGVLQPIVDLLPLSQPQE